MSYLPQATNNKGFARWGVIACVMLTLLITSGCANNTEGADKNSNTSKLEQLLQERKKIEKRVRDAKKNIGGICDCYMSPTSDKSKCEGYARLTERDVKRKLAIWQKQCRKFEKKGMQPNDKIKERLKEIDHEIRRLRQ